MTEKPKIPERMEEAWDRMSSDYSEHTDLAPTEPYYLEFASRFPASQSSLDILDLGSGLGYALDGILPKLPQSKFTCLDISREMLNKLVERLSAYSSQIMTRKDSYVTAELGSNQFDYVLSSFTVHHLTKPTKLALFRKVHQSLKDGGTYFELDGVASPEQERVSQQEYEQYIAHREGAELGDWNHDMCLTIANETRLLLEAGFSEVSVPWQDTDGEGSGRAIFIAMK